MLGADSELAVLAPDSFPTPALVTRARPEIRKKFFEFFTVPIRNANTRSAYYRAIQQFLDWVERAGYQHLEDIEPITVAAYIEILQRQAAPPTVKQHMAAIRMLFSWLTEKGVLAMNPAREVKTEKFSRTEVAKHLVDDGLVVTGTGYAEFVSVPNSETEVLYRTSLRFLEHDTTRKAASLENPTLENPRSNTRIANSISNWVTE